jgi:hypothetical protein
LFGQSAGSIHAVRPAAEVLRDICEKAEALLSQRSADLLQ